MNMNPGILLIGSKERLYAEITPRVVLGGAGLGNPMEKVSMKTSTIPT
jgi:hypothetical protein